jgi:multidrug efflux pump
MNISKFFIDRPIFAGVLSVLILLAGLLSVFQLPIAEYPEVVPPSVVVRAQFPGANPKVIAETVAAPLEESINGVENMLYMQSQANSDGNLTLTVHFQLGVDPDKAQQLVQNRVSQALPRLPEDVQRLGVTTAKSTPTITMVVHLTSPDDRYDMTYLRNYAVLNVKDRLARIKGVGEVGLFGSGNYAMRVWLDPGKVAERGLTAPEIVKAIREQNVQVAAGVIGAPPNDRRTPLQLNVNAQGRLKDEAEFAQIILKTAPDGGVTRLGDVARIELAAAEYGLRALLDNKPAVAIPIFQTPGANALDISDPGTRDHGRTGQGLSAFGAVQHRLRPDPVRTGQHQGGDHHPAGSHRPGGAGGHRLPADLARVHHPAAGGAGVHHRHLLADARLWLLHQRPVAVRHGAGHRHRGG